MGQAYPATASTSKYAVVPELERHGQRWGSRAGGRRAGGVATEPPPVAVVLPSYWPELAL